MFKITQLSSFFKRSIHILVSKAALGKLLQIFLIPDQISMNNQTLYIAHCTNIFYFQLISSPFSGQALPGMKVKRYVHVKILLNCIAQNQWFEDSFYENIIQPLNEYGFYQVSYFPYTHTTTLLFLP